MERFRCGYPEGIESLMAGKIKYGERFEDVWEQLRLLDKKQRDGLMLLVACDRIYGFFEQRGGVANGLKLEQMVRGSVGGKGKVTQKEARYYYDELVKTGILEIVEGLGSKNVFCTVWNYINETLF